MRLCIRRLRCGELCGKRRRRRRRILPNFVLHPPPYRQRSTFTTVRRRRRRRTKRDETDGPQTHTPMYAVRVHTYITFVSITYQAGGHARTSIDVHYAMVVARQPRFHPSVSVQLIYVVHIIIVVRRSRTRRMDDINFVQLRRNSARAASVQRSAE